MGRRSVDALVGLLFPPDIIANTVIGAGLVGSPVICGGGYRAVTSRIPGKALDAGEASLVVISTSQFNHDFTAALKADVIRNSPPSGHSGAVGSSESEATPLGLSSLDRPACTTSPQRSMPTMSATRSWFQG